MKKQPSPFGLWLSQARKSRGWSLQKLADLAGVHRLQIHFAETGRTQLPRQGTRLRLYHALGERAPASIETGARRCSFCAAVAAARPLYRSVLKPNVGICVACLADANSEVAVNQRRRSGQAGRRSARRVV